MGKPRHQRNASLFEHLPFNACEMKPAMNLIEQKIKICQPILGGFVMNKFSKAMKLAASCMAILMALTACGTPTAEQPAANTPDTPAVVENEAPDTPVEEEEQAENERVNITYAFWGNNEELQTLEGVIDKFESEQDRISVEPIQLDRAEYVGALNTFAAGGQLPDTGIMAEDTVLMWAEQGMLADASGMYGADEAKPLDSVTFKYQGQPVGYSVAGNILNIYYNREKFADAGVDAPPASADTAWDWDAFIEVAKEMTIDANGNNGLSPDFDANNIAQYGVMLCPDFWQLEQWSVTNGGAWYDEDGNVTIDSPEAMEGLQRIADLSLVHHVAPQYGTNTATTIDQDLLNNAAMYINGAWSVGVWLGAAKEAGLDYGVGVLPYMEEKVTLATGGVNVAFNTSDNLEEAQEWLKWYAKEENSWDLIASGTWMPVLSKYYTDEEFTRQWVENPNFPPYDEYKSAVVDYAYNNGRPVAWYWVNNTNLFNDALSTILAPCWSGAETVESAITNNIDVLKAANQGM
jgi:multiple sugar transport system substrate-binding protein